METSQVQHDDDAFSPPPSSPAATPHAATVAAAAARARGRGEVSLPPCDARRSDDPGSDVLTRLSRPASAALRSTGIPLATAVRLEQSLAESTAAASAETFHVHRSRMGNLPVYTGIRTGGSRRVTIVRKFAGSATALGEQLERLCESPVTIFHGRVEVKGFHQKKVADWLASLGF